MKIVISVALAAFLFVGCSENSSQTAQVSTPVEKTVVKTVETPKSVATKTDEMVAKAQDMADTVVEKTKEVAVEAEKVANEVVEATKEAAVKAEEVASSAVDATKKGINEVAKDVQDATATVDAGATLYKSCAGCHGASAEKPALGKSQVIKGWSVSKLEHALNGYKDGTYGATMKALMKGQVSKLSSDDIKALSEYISKL